MFRAIVLQDTRPEEWPAIRDRIHSRLMIALGAPPDGVVEPGFEVMDEYENYGLRHRKIRFRVLPDEDGLAVVVLPEGADQAHPAPAVVVCHGTYGWKYGKWGPLTLDHIGDCGYAIELAQRGFAAVSVDNYKCGEMLIGDEDLSDAEIQARRKATTERFAQVYPAWSLDGIRMLYHQRLLDVLDGLDCIQPKTYGVMGNSLGGRMAIFLIALDERIGAAVPACGISPNLTNVYRSGGASDYRGESAMSAHFRRTGGKTLYDYQDMIALSAPRPLLLVDPYNDLYNPYIMANFQCYVEGQRAYELLGKPECFCTLTHGDGHATLDDVRDFAYRWFERWLR